MANNIDNKIWSATVKINEMYKLRKKGFTNSAGYQCVALMQGLFKLANVGFEDAWLATAWNYGVKFRNGFNSDKEVMGLKPKEWKVVTTYQAGDILFFKPTINNKAGHVAIASSDKYRLEQNIKGKCDGSDPNIYKSPIGKPDFGIRKIVKTSSSNLDRRVLDSKNYIVKRYDKTMKFTALRNVNVRYGVKVFHGVFKKLKKGDEIKATYYADYRGYRWIFVKYDNRYYAIPLYKIKPGVKYFSW